MLAQPCVFLRSRRRPTIRRRPTLDESQRRRPSRGPRARRAQQSRRRRGGAAASCPPLAGRGASIDLRRSAPSYYSALPALLFKIDSQVAESTYCKLVFLPLTRRRRAPDRAQEHRRRREVLGALRRPPTAPPRASPPRASPSSTPSPATRSWRRGCMVVMRSSCSVESTMHIRDERKQVERVLLRDRPLHARGVRSRIPERSE